MVIGLTLIDSIHSVTCPFAYNSILNGCYKVNNGSRITWSDAKKYCANETNKINMNNTNYTVHLLALESAIETTSLVYWLKAWSIQSQFWTDGIVASSTWSWSDQTLMWYFNSSERLYDGNGTHFRLTHNSAYNSYQVVDDSDNTPSNFICEYQEQCNSNNSCQNGATCYWNVGRELCLCAPGYTGSKCDEEIDECLMSPCQHGGLCTDHLNNYTCNCSDIFFTGANCEISVDDPGKNQRSAAFWSVLGVVCSLVALLTISDLPWDDIGENLGCPWFSFRCCSKTNQDEDEDLDNVDYQAPDAPTPNDPNDFITVSREHNKGVNYQVMNTVWNPEKIRHEIGSNQTNDGFRSPDQSVTPDNILIKSFATAVLEKQRQKRNPPINPAIPESQREQVKSPVDDMADWTQQIQEQLKSNSKRENSASSTKKLISTTKNYDDQ